MAHYRRVGEVPPKRHTQHRAPDGSLYYEELMGEEGFSSDSSLLYHRGVPSAIVASEVWELPDQTRTPNHPLMPRHLRLHDLRDRPGPGDRPPAGARQQRRPDRLRRHRHRPLAALPQRDRRRVRLRRVRHRHGRDGVRGADLPRRRLRDRAARHHAPLAARRAVAALRDRGQQPHRSAEALPVPLRAAARARAVLRARPLRPDRRPPRRGRPTSRCWSSTARAARSSARGSPTPPTPSTSSAGTAASTPTRSTSTTTCRSPARSTSRRRCTRSSRATTSWSATSCPARSTTTSCRSRCPTTTPTSTPTR